MVRISKIESKDTYYLGYLVAVDLKKRREQLEAVGKSTVQLDEEERRRSELLETGEFNHHCYLDYDHMDVYVATSMREKADFWKVSGFVNEVFGKPEIKELKLRYFDPTQAYCPHRIDKGLSEALMLKRAECAIYMAGESDTLGKDSELAATLAQGKPVIVYVPRLSDYGRFKSEIVEPLLNDVYVDEDPARVALDFLKSYAPKSAWEQRDVREWIETNPEFDTILPYLYDCLKDIYEQRARTLLETHPLGLQVNLKPALVMGSWLRVILPNALD